MTLQNVFKFIRLHRFEVLSIGLISLLAFVLRAWRISEYLTFLGDEGRDVRIVRDLLHGNLVFIGPMTSIGNMYLGPLYYYLMAPALWLSRLDPTGPAVMVALLSTLTIVFTWWVGRTWFSSLVGILAALLFALSPVAIIYGRASWNPNPMPFFSLLCVWSIWQVWKHHHFFWLIIAGTSLAFALQMHYLSLLLIPTLGLFWLLTLKQIWTDKLLKKSFLQNTLYSLLIFAFLMSPLVLFDIKHNGQNLHAFQAFFSDRQTTVNLNPARSDRFLPAIESVTAELLLGRQLTYALLASFIIALLSIWAYFGKAKLTLSQFLKSKKNPALNLLFTWIGFGILGLGIYKQHIYAHYFGFLFPAVYLLIGFLLAFLFKKTLLFKILALILLSCLIFHALVYSPLRESPNRQLQRTVAAVDLIIKESGGEEFNFALLAKQNYDESYRYFFENKQAKMIRGEDHPTQQLFVICEDGDKCQPESNPAYQIAIFGASHVVATWQIDYLKIYRLITSK